MTVQSNDQKSSREWQLIEKMLLSASKEQRNARRWGIFFKLLTFSYIALFIVVFSMQGKLTKLIQSANDHVGVIDVAGPIMAGSSGLMGNSTNADSLISSLNKAYKTKTLKALIIRINSPGGSPVQSGYVYDEIKRLREKHPDIPVYAVIEDIGASGAYYIAAAADKIYADKASLVGSIGVIHSSFGFVDAIEKLGIERRVLTAGENKAFLDPFLPATEEHQAALKTILSDVHQQFIAVVKEGRGDRLTDDSSVFSGLIWSGEEAIKLGLIDGLGSTQSVARDIIEIDNIVYYSASDSPLEQLTKSSASAFANAAIEGFLQRSGSQGLQ